jgi:hypothetical protein
MSDQLKHNLFRFASSELSHSAFWAWVLQSLDAPANRDLETAQELAEALLIEIGAPLPQTDIEVETEVSIADGRLDIRAMIDGETLLIIENKTSISPNVEQLLGYQEELEQKEDQNLHLAIISTAFDRHVSNEIKGMEWVFLDVKILTRLLNSMTKEHPLVNDYSEWLRVERERREVIEKQALSDSYEKLKKGLTTPLGQWILMSRVMAEANSQAGTRGKQYRGGEGQGGRPWTQFRFTPKKPAPERDALFYRIDRYSKGFYFSLRQYQYKPTPNWDAKRQRLEHLRALWKRASKQENEMLVSTPPRDNNAEKESKISMYYLDENPPSILIQEIPKVHRAFVEALREDEWPLL